MPFRISKDAVIDSFERSYLSQLLEAAGGNMSKAARMAGMDRMYLHRLVQKHGLRGGRNSSAPPSESTTCGDPRRRAARSQGPGARLAFSGGKPDVGFTSLPANDVHDERGDRLGELARRDERHEICERQDAMAATASVASLPNGGV